MQDDFTEFDLLQKIIKNKSPEELLQILIKEVYWIRYTLDKLENSNLFMEKKPDEDNL